MDSFGNTAAKAEAWIAGVLLVLMVVFVFTGGIARMMHTPMNWTIDAATWAFAWATFLCADIAWRRDSLMAVDLFTRRLPISAQKGLTILNYVLIIAFLIFLVVTGLWLSWTSWERSFRGIPSISYSWITLSLPVGGLLLLVTTGLKVKRDVFLRSRA
ncbi:TRAP transporter small permease subunit [Litchfieldella rifensis]|uniref:TRAP transporter small permease protein n=1 Tax=Litchfieldella rifensis TaxID=762643 RepID=A0ABV7LIW5_9GAMM